MSRFLLALAVGLAIAGPTLAADVTADLSDGFFAKIKVVATNLQCESLDLLKVMKSESNVKATAHNANGHASGLIQFMPATLKNLGWTKGHEDFRKLTAEEQLPYVEMYFKPHVKEGLGSAARLYQVTFLPATMKDGSTPDTVICKKGGKHDFAYEPNKVFDTAKKGYITVGDLQAAIDRNAKGSRWEEIEARLTGKPINRAIDLATMLGKQRALVALGYKPGDPDGADGPKTQAAAREFQKAHGLSGDGKIGPMTTAKLRELLKAKGVEFKN